jgi:hypothetical protein
LGAFRTLGQATEDELKTKAEKFYKEKNYVEATRSYLQLLSLQPRDPFYNMRYGTCLLYNSEKKEQAIRYLEYAAKNEKLDAEVFFFLGKAYHLNYRFTEAVAAYTDYKFKAGAKIETEFEVDRAIEMSNSGKRLLQSMNELVVYDKKEYRFDQFYRLYNLEDIGGNIVVGTSYQSKIDKKNNHVPIIHFPANAKVIYHSSYGENETKSKDICMRKKLPNGTWSEPIAIVGGVNTAFDEDFPFMDAKGEYLYFSSKGHNSMGGFDIFRAKFDPISNSFGTPENLDFPISSADDDLFYIADSLDNLAFFASSRQSKDGKIHIYKVRVNKLPSQTIAVKGFVQNAKNDGKTAEITVVDLDENKVVGTFETDPDGRYLLVLPREGNYEYQIRTTDDDKSYKNTVSFMKQREFKPLKQTITVNETTETVLIENLFNETVDDPLKVLAEIISLKAELNPNAELFLKQTNETSREFAIAAKDLGMERFSPREVKEKILTDTKKQEIRVENLKETEKQALQAAKNQLDYIVAEQAEIKKLSTKAETVSDPTEKLELLSKAQEKINQIRKEEESVSKLLAFSDSLKGVVQLEETKLQNVLILKQLTEPLEEDEGATLKFLQENKALIQELKEKSDRIFAEELSVAIQEEKIAQKKLKDKKQEIVQSETAIEKEIRDLEFLWNRQKEKERVETRKQIDSKKRELELVVQEKKIVEKKIDNIGLKIEALEEDLAYIKTVQQTKIAESTISTEQVKSLQKSSSSTNFNTLAAYIAQQKEELEKNPANSAVVEQKKQSNEIGGVKPDYQERIAAIENNSQLSNIEKLEALNAEEKKLQQKIAERERELTATLAENPSDEKGKKELESLNELKKASEEKAAVNQAAIDQFQEKNNPLANLPPVASVEEAHRKQMDAIASNPDLTEKEKRARLLEAEKQYNADLNKQKDELAAIKGAKQSEVEIRDSELEALISTSNKKIESFTEGLSNVSKSLPETVEELKPNHSETLRKIEENDLLSEKEKKSKISEQESKLLTEIEKRQLALEKELLTKPEDDKLLQEKQALAQLKTSTEAKQNELKQELIQLEKADIKPNELLASVDKKYEKEIEQLLKNNADSKVLIAREELLQQNLQTKVTQNETKLAKTESIPLEAQNKVLNNLIDDSQKRVEVYQEKANKQVLAEKDTLPKNEQVAPEKKVLTEESLREKYLKENVTVFKQETSGKTTEELTENRAVLTSYSEELKTEAKTLQTALKKDKKEETKQALAVVEAEKKTVDARISEINQELEKRKNVATTNEKDTVNQNQSSEVEKVDLASLREKNGSDAILNLEKPTQELTDTELTDYQSSLEKYSKVLTEEERQVKTAKNTYSSAEKSKALKELQAEQKIISERIEALELEEKKRRGTASVELQPTKEERIETVKNLLQNPSLSESERKNLEEELSALTGVASVETSNPASNQTNPQTKKDELFAKKTKLNEEDLSVKEEKKLKAEIQVLETEILEEKVAEKKQLLVKNEAVLDEKVNRLSTPTTSSSELSVEIEAIKVAYSEQKKAQQTQLQALEKSKDSKEKNELLNQQLVAQNMVEDRVEDALREVILSTNAGGKDVNGYQSTQVLQSRKYTISIELGELKSELEKTVEQLQTAKKGQLPALQSKKENLEQKIVGLENEILAIEKVLALREKVPAPSVVEKSIETELTYEEELKISQSDTYKDYFSIQNELIEIKKSITSEKEKSEKNRNRIAELIHESVETGVNADEKISQLIQENDAIEQKLQVQETRYAALDQQRKSIEETITQEDELMKMQNLILRGVEPLVLSTVIATSVPIPSNGFEFNPVVAPETKRMELPLETSVPSGLVYRVQVGAFAKPIPEERFNEFSPVSGEKLPSGITRYMAGYFNNKEAVLNAQKQIRGIGYADAFPVAYCDGKRISLDEARRLEQSGACVPKGVNDLVVELQQNAGQVVLDDSLKIKKMLADQSAYNRAPGAAAAIAVETKLGLFYTVQIGVFNKPVSKEKLNNMQPLVTKRLANGQIRYSAGIFSTIDDAQPKKKEAQARGISDAFITAYYKGERITLEEAKNLVAQNGNQILENKQAVENKILPQNELAKLEAEAKNQALENVVTEKVKVRDEALMFVSTKTYDEFPHDILRRFNTKGSFYFDQEDKRVKSIIYKNEDYVPQVYYFRSDIDTLYLRDIPQTETKLDTLTFTSSDQELAGDFTNWLIRMGYQRTLIQQEDKTFILHILGTFTTSQRKDLETTMESFRWVAKL